MFSHIENDAHNLKFTVGETTVRGRWNNCLLAALTVFFFLGLSFLVCGRPKFETNDDVVLSMLVAGVGFVDKPEHHMLYSHYWIGRALCWLYSLNSDFSWYSIYLFAAQVLSMTIIVRILLKRLEGRSACLLIPVFLIAVCLRPTQLMQFTTTASLLASAGALYFFDELEKTVSLPKMFWYMFCSGAIFCGAAAIRFGSAKLILLLSICFLLCKYFPLQDWRRLRVGLPVLSLILALCCALEYHNGLYYESSSWREFYPLNALRFSITEFGRVGHLSPKVVKAFTDINWSPVDKESLCSYCFLDRNTYSLEALGRLDAALPRLRRLTLSGVWNTLWPVLSDPSIVPGIVGLIFVGLTVDKKKLSIPSRICFYLLMLGVVAFFLLTMKLPLYLLSGIIGFVLIMLVWSSSAVAVLHKSGKPAVTLTICLVATLLFLLSSACAVEYHRQRTAQIDIARKQLRNSLNKLDRRYLYVIWANCLQYEAVRPFDNLNNYFGGLKLLGFCFLGRTPVTLRRLEQFKIDDLMAEIYRPQVRLISGRWLNEILDRFYRSHYKRSLEFESVEGNQKIGLAVYKVHLLPGNALPAHWDRWPQF